MYDLIYAGKEVEQIILKQFPEAKTRAASDCVHPERFTFQVDIPTEDFYIFAIREGFALCCLSFNLMTMDHPKGSLQEAWDLMAEAEALDESEK